MIRTLSNIDEWDDNHYEKEFVHEKSQHTCDMCKTKFNADHVVIKSCFMEPIYDDSWLTIKIRDSNITKRIQLDICPECTEKLLELLDKHWPRLNLEDEL